MIHAAGVRRTRGFVLTAQRLRIQKDENAKPENW
jgi:hypothetical protein